MFWTKPKSTTWKRPPDRDVKELQQQVEDLRSQLEAEQRKVDVRDVEINELSAVIARNLERVKAESALAARERAEHEGSTNRERD